MNDRRLWTVLADRQPVAVVAAGRPEDAWRIVAALDEYGDLPKDRAETDLVPCPSRQSAHMFRLARSLGCATTFLACLKGGMFLTHIEGLATESRPSVPTEWVA